MYRRSIPELLALHKAPAKPKPLLKLQSQLQRTWASHGGCPGLAWSAVQTGSIWGRGQEVTALKPTSFRHTACNPGVYLPVLTQPYWRDGRSHRDEPAALEVRAQPLRSQVFSPCPSLSNPSQQCAQGMVNQLLLGVEEVAALQSQNEHKRKRGPICLSFRALVENTHTTFC